jgi:two-component system alkaline phosphatase synthesis response regulator PhoP
MLPTTPSRILIIGADAAGREEVAGRLSGAGHEILQLAALSRRDHYQVDLIILCADKAEDFAAGCGEIRRHPSLKTHPLLGIIPERALEKFDFSAGADDLLLAPWRPIELLLRVNLALWRRDRTGSAQILKVGDLTIDLTNYTARFRGELMEMTLKEFELLCHLASNPGRVFTRAVLLNRVWGYEYFGGTRTVDVHIRRLRAKLGDWGEEMIQTVRGVGYRFHAG